MTGWLSVDPLADKYSSISPYAYCAWNPINLVDPNGKKIKGVKYNSYTGTYSFSKWAIKNGTSCFVNELIKTDKGIEILNGLMVSPTIYKVRVTDLPLFGTSINGGKFIQFGGRFVEKHNTIWISTAMKINENKHGKSIKGYYFDPVTDEWTKQSIKCSEIESNINDIYNEYNRAYKDSGMYDFEQNPKNQYNSTAEIIHGRGVHEGTHALQDPQKDDYSREYEALKNEQEARTQYKEVCP